MRCARCDQLILRQATGVNPDGEVVFGWCLPCMTEVGCTFVTTNKVDRRKSTRVILTERPHVISPNAKMLRGVAGGIATWSGILLLAGLWRLFEPGFAANPSPFGNGGAVLFLVGALSLGILGLGLYASTWSSSRRGQVLGYLAATLTGSVSVGLSFVALWTFPAAPWPARAAFFSVAVILAALSTWSVAATRQVVPRVTAPYRVTRQPRSPNP